MSDRNRLLPRLRFPEFRDAGDWSRYTLKQLAKFRRGSFPQPYGLPEWYDETNGLPFIQVFDVGNDLKLKPTTKRKISKIAAEKSVFVVKGTLIITIQGSIGRVAITQYDAYIDRTLLLFEQFIKATDKIFFAYSIQKLFEIEREKAPGGIIKTITKQVLSNFQIKLPNFTEQQKIAACLSSLDDLITAQGQKLETLKAHKKGLMQQLFPAEGETQPRLRFPEFRDAGEWQEMSLGKKVIKIGSGITPKGGEKAYKRNGRPFVRSQNIGWGRLILDKVAFIDEETHSTFSSTEIKTDDVLLNITGASIGRSAIADNRIHGGNVNQHVCIIRTKSSELKSNYLNQYLLSEIGQKQIDSFQAGGNRQGLNFGQIRSFSLPLPKDIKEQQKIAAFLTSLDDLITAQGQKLDALKAHKKGLMQQLFPTANEANG